MDPGLRCLNGFALYRQFAKITRTVMEEEPKKGYTFFMPTPADKDKKPPVVEVVDIDIAEPEPLDEPTTYAAKVTLREPMIHFVGRGALSFASSMLAERLSNIAYDKLLKLYRAKRK